MSKSTDWHKVKTYYLALRAKQEPSALIKAAEHFGLNYGTVKNKASKEQWAEQADGFTAEVEAKVEAKMAEKVATKIANRRMKELDEQLEFVGFLKKKAIIALSAENVNLTTGQAVQALVKALELEGKLQEKVHAEAAKPQGDDMVSRFNKFVEMMHSSAPPQAANAA